MNHYAILARDWWTRNVPARLASLEDQEQFFVTLGESAAQQIAAIEDAAIANLPDTLPYLERVAQLQAIRKQAEEIVLSDLVFSLPPETTVGEELDELLGNLPGLTTIDQMMRRIRDDAEDEAERENRPEVTLSDEQEQRMLRLNRLRVLVAQGTAPGALSASQQRDLVLALRTLWDEMDGAARI